MIYSMAWISVFLVAVPVSAFQSMPSMTYLHVQKIALKGSSLSMDSTPRKAVHELSLRDLTKYPLAQNLDKRHLVPPDSGSYEVPIIPVPISMVLGEKDYMHIWRDSDGSMTSKAEIVCPFMSEAFGGGKPLTGIANVAYVCKIADSLPISLNRTALLLHPTRRVQLYPPLSNANTAITTALVHDMDVPLAHLQSKEVSEEVRAELIQQEKLCAQIYKDVCIIKRLNSWHNFKTTGDTDELAAFMHGKGKCTAEKLTLVSLPPEFRIRAEMYIHRPVQAWLTSLRKIILEVDMWLSLTLKKHRLLEKTPIDAPEITADMPATLQALHAQEVRLVEEELPELKGLIGSNVDSAVVLPKAHAVVKKLRQCIAAALSLSKLLYNGTRKFYDWDDNDLSATLGRDQEVLRKYVDDSRANNSNTAGTHPSTSIDLLHPTAATLRQRQALFSLTACVLFEHKDPPMTQWEKQDNLQKELLPHLQSTADIARRVKSGTYDLLTAMKFIAPVDQLYMETTEAGEDSNLCPEDVKELSFADINKERVEEMSSSLPEGGFLC